MSPFNVKILGSEWPETIAFCQNTRVLNKDLAGYYASSFVTLNIGRHFSLANNKYQLDATTPGPRTFEAAMAGAVQCAYLEGLELADYFVFGEEILVFDSPSELYLLIEELRSNCSFHKQIAEKSQARALKDHTYAARAKVILSKITSVAAQIL